MKCLRDDTCNGTNFCESLTLMSQNKMAMLERKDFCTGRDSDRDKHYKQSRK